MGDGLRMASAAGLPSTMLLASTGVVTAYALGGSTPTDLPLIVHPTELATLTVGGDSRPPDSQMGLTILNASTGGQDSPSPVTISSPGGAAFSDMAILDTFGARDALKVVVNSSGTLTIRRGPGAGGGGWRGARTHGWE